MNQIGQLSSLAADTQISVKKILKLLYDIRMTSSVKTMKNADISKSSQMIYQSKGLSKSFQKMYVLLKSNDQIKSYGHLSMIYLSSIEHGGMSIVFYMMEQFDNMGERAQFSVWWINILVAFWRYPQRGSQTKNAASLTL